jgi:hypothetical protein
VPLAAALLVAVLVISGLLPGSRDEASAAQVLNSLAEVAAAQPAEPADMASGYRYTKSEGIYLATVAGRGGQGFSALVPKSREIWIAPDGSGRLRESAGEPIFLGERDRARWQAAGSPQMDFTHNRDYGPGGLHYEDLTRLPTDPNALAAVIRTQAEATSKGGPPVNLEMFVIVGDLLRETGAPPALRAALYKVAAKIPGTELVGPVTDRAGRPGVAVARTLEYTGAKQRKIYIFDRSTSMFLAEEEILLERAGSLDAKPPGTIRYTLYLESKMVPALP